MPTHRSRCDLILWFEQLEGTNDIEPNHMTLHTSANCAQPAVGRDMTGYVDSSCHTANVAYAHTDADRSLRRAHSNSVTDNCDVAANGNAGCGVEATQPNSYGKSFNAAGGGFYAMERTSSFIKVWFWSRNDPTVPADVLNACTTVNTDAWVSTVSFVIPPSHLASLPRPRTTRGRPTMRL